MSSLGIPNLTYGAGLFWKIENSTELIFPIRDDSAPSSPCKVDCQIGYVGDESLISAQIREGTEETVILRDRSGETQLGIPSFIKDTKFEESLKYYYESAVCDSSSPLKQYDSTFYYKCKLKEPRDFPIKTINSEYETGYVFNFNNDTITEELINMMSIELETEELKSGDYYIYDLENTTHSGYQHFNRPVILLDYQTGDTLLFKSGEVKFEDDISNLRSYLTNTLGWELNDSISTCKVQAILQSFEKTSSNVRKELIDEEYIKNLSIIGETMKDMK